MREAGSSSARGLSAPIKEPSWRVSGRHDRYRRTDERQAAIPSREAQSFR